MKGIFCWKYSLTNLLISVLLKVSSPSRAVMLFDNLAHSLAPTLLILSLYDIIIIVSRHASKYMYRFLLT